MSEQPTVTMIVDPLGDMARALDLLTECTRPAMMHAVMLKDRAIAEALAEIQPLWTKEEIARRCVIIRCVGDAREQLFVDGIAVLCFEEPESVQEWKDDRMVVTFTQKFRRVRAVKL